MTASIVGTALAGAASAADRAGVDIRMLTSPAELEQVGAFFTDIWGTDSAVIRHDLLRAIVYAGNYASGAFEGSHLVGGSVAFFGPPEQAVLHSHVTAVDAASRNRGIAYALKLHQRSWALAAGIRRITWTFDPLRAKNAFFNIERLGARITAYLPNHYGALSGKINGDLESDRLLVEWDLIAGRDAVPMGRSSVPALIAAGASAGLSADDDGAPVKGADSDLVLVQVPTAIPDLHSSSAQSAQVWRRAVRDVLGTLILDGAEVIGFLRSGWYVLDTRGRRT